MSSIQIFYLYESNRLAALHSLLHCLLQGRSAYYGGKPVKSANSPIELR